MRPLADGRIYTAAQAVEHHLADEVAYLPQVIEALAEVAGIDSPEVVSYLRGRRADASLYSANSSREWSLDLRLDPLSWGAERSGLYYLWLPDGARVQR